MMMMMIINRSFHVTDVSYRAELAVTDVSEKFFSNFRLVYNYSIYQSSRLFIP